ncbi:anti-sigma factor family protein [Pseudomonas panipatensis]|jgi:anti-sigma factor RsiW|uniref:Putative zinc-finger n=1 Tax=Pseudomonas panipatensis TaxID=428992 RepID=A0A1G8BVH7_9PSED|nr:zf-HC2 domain-containing protein [Pseudomonas panipatensis]SDH37227.1 Putative zinc-finger [Pseudomonas panipatensis]SMP72091.1 Putative zinc-finger [Pseudomonas panipatensis]
MLTCKQLVALSSDLLDSQLSLREKLAVRRHLLVCRNCRRFLKQMRLTRATLRLLPEAPSPELDLLAARLAELRRDNARR